MTLGSHQTTIGKSQTYITPQLILDALGPFDLDPCAAYPRPWDCAVVNWSRAGLGCAWFGKVWLNPPFDRRGVGAWLARMAEHDNGIALVHARTETAWFQHIWRGASALLFLADRIHFHDEQGRRYSANSGAPVALAAFGDECRQRLRGAPLDGILIEEWAHHG